MNDQRWKRLAGLAWATWLAMTPALAQTPPTASASVEPDPVVSDVVDVRVVNVEVVVTDSRGKRVTGLKPGDFRLEVDGKPVPLEYFTEVREGKAAPAKPGAASPESLQEALPAGLEPGGTIGTNYLVFVDDFFSIKANRDVVLHSLKRQIGQLGPADRMSVVAWNGARLVRLSPWSSSRKDLEQSLEKAMERPSLGLARQVQFRKFLAEASLQTTDSPDQDDLNFQLYSALGSGPGLNLLEVAYGRLVADEVGSAARAVTAALRGSDPPEGRKVLLLLSGGWPLSVQSFIQGDEMPSASKQLPQTVSGLQVLADTANLLGYTIYPVDVPGVRSTTRDVLDNPREGQASFIGGMGMPENTSPGLTSYSRDLPSPGQTPFSGMTPIRDQELRATIAFLAHQTGGQPMFAGNREAVLSRASEDVRSYYWLGFSPAWPRDGRIHRINARVLRDGLRTRARQGFLDLTTNASATMKFESSLLFGDLRTEDSLNVRLGTPAKGARKGVTEVPVTVEIPVKSVTLLPAEDGRYKGRVQMRFAAVDDAGNQSLIPVLNLQLVSPRPPSEGGAVRYQTKIFLRGQASRVAVAVFDPLTGKIAAGQANLGAQ
jgi:VWFA-related protein